MPENLLYYGDNLDVLRRHIASDSVDLIYLDPPFNSKATYNVLFAERNRQEQTKDNTGRRVALSGGILFPVSSSDRLFFSGSATMLRYDTPSETNLEDRDELLVALTAGSFHRVSRTLDVGVTVDATLSHLVYLLEERSANNNINRVIRLTPRTLIRPAAWCFSQNAFEVLANYTVYDYEQQVAMAKSFSYRQFSWIDSTRIDLTHSVGLDFYAYLKLYERGMLRWDEFVERTENSTADRTFSGQIRFSPTAAAVFAVGGHGRTAGDAEQCLYAGSSDHRDLRDARGDRGRGFFRAAPRQGKGLGEAS